MESPENWHFPYLNDEMSEAVKAATLANDALLFGRVTYQDFVSFWPTQTNNEFGIADKLNNTPKFVFSSTLEKADWNNSTLIKGNVAEEVARLKQQIGGCIGITGSGMLAQTLMQANLIDEYQLMVHPVVVGSGKRLFKDGIETTGLKLVNTATFSSGVVFLTYQVQ